MTAHTRSEIALAVLPTIVTALLAAPRTGPIMADALARDSAALAFAVADAFVGETVEAEPAPEDAETGRLRRCIEAEIKWHEMEAYEMEAEILRVTGYPWGVPVSELAEQHKVSAERLRRIICPPFLR